MKLHKYIMLLSVPLALAACGGGDSGGDRPVTKPPVANAGTDQTVPMGTKVELDGSASAIGTNGSTLSYRWSMNTKPAGSGAVFTDASVVAPSFHADLPGQYVINLVVNDGVGDSQPDSVTVRATTTVPVAIVDVLQKVGIGATVTLDGSQSAVPEGGNVGALVYRWDLLSKPSGSEAQLVNSTTTKPTFHADKEGEYRLQLVVRYGNEDSEPREVTVQAVAANRAPVAVPTVVSVNGQPAQPTRPGRLTYKIERGQEVKLDGSSSTDADGDTLSYRWSVRMDNSDDRFAGSKLVSGSQLGGVSFPYGAQASFTPDVVGTWKAVLSVFDGVASSSAVVTFTVTKPENAPNMPPVVGGITHAYGTHELEFKQPVTLTPTPSYDIDGDNLYHRFRWRFIDYPAGFEPPPFKLEFFGFNFTPTVKGAYTVEVIANDGQADSLPFQATFTAKSGANRAPAGSITLDKKTVLVGQDLIYTCGGNDPDGNEMSCRFTLDNVPEGSQTQMRVDGHTAIVRTDKPGAYAVSVRVTDEWGAERDSRYFPINGVGYATLSNAAPIVGDASILFNSAEAGNIGQYTERASFAGDSASFALGSVEQPMLAGGALRLGVSFVDPDGDDLSYLTVLKQQPEQGGLPEAVDLSVYQATPTKPGRYVLGYIAYDGLTSTSQYDVAFNVIERKNYPSLLLETAGMKLDNWSASFYGQAAFPFVKHLYNNNTYAQNGGNVYGQTYRLTAFDRDYTITDLKATSANSAYLPWFTGLSNNQVIKKGETVEFMTFRPYIAGESESQSVPGEQVAALDFAWSFRVAEKNGWTFDVRN